MGAEEEKSQAKDTSTPTSNPTPITEAQFLSWKLQKDAELSARQAEAARKRAEDISAGTVQMNGRELFLHQPWNRVLKIFNCCLELVAERHGTEDADVED